MENLDSIQRLLHAELPDSWINFRDMVAVRSHVAGYGEFTEIGQSRSGQEMVGYSFGTGERKVSVIGGSHADEPMGPMTAQILVEAIREFAPHLLDAFTFYVVPQMNPDGSDANRPWFNDPVDFKAYAKHAIREQPGDDIEFGFSAPGLRPENDAAMAYLKGHGPYDAHFSLHGMGFAEGAWFLIHEDWIPRTAELQDMLTCCCAARNVGFHDIDRKGLKGFTRIAPGYCTTPNHVAMRAFFEAEDDLAMAAKFYPSSMEWVTSLGGGPLCMVSEMPLFLIDGSDSSLEDPVLFRFRDDLIAARVTGTDAALDALIEKHRVESFPLKEHMRYQLLMVMGALEMLLAS